MHSNRKNMMTVRMSFLLVATVAMLMALATEQDEPTSQKPSSNELERVVVQGQGVRDPAWISYRETFQAMKMYLDSSSADDPLEPRFVLRPLKDMAPTSDELRLSLASAGTRTIIPLEHYWGFVPYDKQAFDLGSEFLLNAPPGTFKLTRTIAIKRQDGNYSLLYLQHACESAREVLRGMNFGYRVALVSKKCVGVNFYFPASEGVDQAPDIVGLSPKKSFAPSEFGMMEYRFAKGGQAEIRIPHSLISITPIFE